MSNILAIASENSHPLTARLEDFRQNGYYVVDRDALRGNLVVEDGVG